MNSDSHLLFEAYKKAINEHASTCEYAKEGCKCNGCKDCKANQTKNEDSEEELGPDPKDLAQYDEYEKARKEISYDKYPFWDAYHAVKEGAWSEDDFHQWAQTVWNDGVNQSHHRHH